MLSIDFHDGVLYGVDGNGKVTKSVTKEIVVNGVRDGYSHVDVDQKQTVACIGRADVQNMLLDASFDEVGKYLTQFYFSLKNDLWGGDIKAYITCEPRAVIDIYSIKIKLKFESLRVWAKPYSMDSYIGKFASLVSDRSGSEVLFWQNDTDSLQNGFGIFIYVRDSTEIIRKEYEFITALLNAIFLKIANEFEKTTSDSSLFKFYHFPAEIRTTCSQYLIYFAQFLNDLGIEADVEIKQAVSQTLFKITPKDQTESLKRIGEALEIYLNSPAQQNFSSTISNETDIAVKQWESQVYRLKSDLALATSIIQANQAAIQAQSVTIQSLQLNIYETKQELFDSNQDTFKQKEENLAFGIITIRPDAVEEDKLRVGDVLTMLKRSPNNLFLNYKK